MLIWNKIVVQNPKNRLHPSSSNTKKPNACTLHSTPIKKENPNTPLHHLSSSKIPTHYPKLWIYTLFYAERTCIARMQNMKKNSLFSFYSRSLGFTISAQSEPQAPVVVSQIIRPGPPRAPRHPVFEEKKFLENWWWRVCEDSKKLPCFLENILCFPILFLVIKDSSHTDSCNFHVLEDLTFQLFSEPFQETTSLTLGLHQWGPPQPS